MDDHVYRLDLTSTATDRQQTLLEDATHLQQLKWTAHSDSEALWTLGQHSGRVCSEMVANEVFNPTALEEGKPTEISQ